MFWIKLDRRAADRMLKVAPGIAAAETVKECRRLAQWMRDEVSLRVRAQLFKHRPLQVEYKRRKRKKGLDERVLIATGDYIRSISFRKVHSEEYRQNIFRRSRQLVAYRVGVPNSIHRTSGLRMGQLARIHEFGSRRANVPARPHWRPVWSILLGSSRKSLKDIRRKTLSAVKSSQYYGIAPGKYQSD